MRIYKKILAVVDETDSSENAFRQACKIARQNKSQLTAIATILPHSEQLEVLHAKTGLGRPPGEGGDKILFGFEKIAQEEDVSVESLLKGGRPSDIIIDVVEEGGYDLIVMGRYGITRLEKAVMGSIAGRIIGYSNSDVLVIPEGNSLRWNNILLSTDGSKYSVAATEHAVACARAYGGNLTAVSVVDVTDEFYAQAPDAFEMLVEKAKKILEDVRKKAETCNVHVETIVKEGDVYLKIAELAKEKKADVIFMGSHGRTGITSFLLGSVTKGVISHSPCPVFVMKL